MLFWDGIDVIIPVSQEKKKEKKGNKDWERSYPKYEDDKPEFLPLAEQIH